MIRAPTTTGEYRGAMRDDYLSMKPFEVRCRWWRPESPSAQVPGVVGFNGTHIIALLDEWVGPEHPLSFPSAPLLHGKTVDGASVSAFNAFVSRYGPEVELVVNSMGVGAHLAQLSEQQFTQARALINGLDEWRRGKQLRVTHEPTGRTVIECAPPSALHIPVPDRSASISLGQEMRQVGAGRRIEVVYESHFLFVPDAPQTAEWFHGIVQETRQLISLCIDQDAGLAGLSLTPANDSGSSRPVQWFWNRRDPQLPEISRTRMLLSSGELEDQLEDALRNWLSKTEELRHSRALLFSTEAAPAAFIEARFLPIVQALEVYCRALESETYIPAAEFSDLKKKLLSAIPRDLDSRLQQKLRTSIGFANEWSLKDRILQLLSSLEEGTRRCICQDPEKFARRMTDSRNYYTHYGASKGKELRGKALHWATEQATLLLKIIMLKECGIRESLIQERLEQSGYHSQSAQIWAEIEREL